MGGHHRVVFTARYFRSCVHNDMNQLVYFISGAKIVETLDPT